MNKNNFIAGNQYSYKKDNKTLTYSGKAKNRGVGVFKSNSGNVYHYKYENMVPFTKPEPKYPNPPIVHCKERIAHAKGANIECQYPNHKTWYNDDDPSWQTKFRYRVKVEKTKDQLRIEQLEKLIAADSLVLDKYKKELSQLKPTVHY